MNKSQFLRELLARNETLVVPDAYDPISARIIEQAGFQAVQCSGFSYSLAACKKHEIDIGLEENLTITQKIIETVAVPVMADGEDGFGGVDHIPLTIQRYVKIGAAGINLEDQILDRKPGTRIIEACEMGRKISTAKAAAKAAGNPLLVINGRTDALKAYSTRQEGIRESIRRGNLYLEAGADMVFVAGVSTLPEVEELVMEIHGPLSIAAGLAYNLEAFSINDLKNRGVARVSLPFIAIAATIKALTQSMESLKSGEFAELLEAKRLCNRQEIKRLIDR
jgi:2-methylisocitrate lyase-like PEP mutase family enzyme